MSDFISSCGPLTFKGTADLHTHILYLFFYLLVLMYFLLLGLTSCLQSVDVASEAFPRRSVSADREAVLPSSAV